MHPEKFSDHAELHNYAERHGLEYLWEGTRHSRGASARYRPSSSRFARLAPTGGCVRFSCSRRTSWSLNGFGISPAGTGLQQNALACGPRTRLGLLSQVLLALGIGLLAALVLVFAIGTLLIWISLVALRVAATIIFALLRQWFRRWH